LRLVDVLVLIYEDMSEAFLHLAAEGGVLLEPPRHDEEQVVKVQSAVMTEALSVLLNALADTFEIGGVLDGIPLVVEEGEGRLERVAEGSFLDADEVADAEDLGVVGGQSGASEAIAEEGVLRLFVEDGEVGANPIGLGIVAEETGTDVVEGADPDLTADAVAEELMDSAVEFLRRLVGEGEGEDLLRRHTPRSDEVGDAIGDDARFAGSRSREDKQRGIPEIDGLALLFVEGAVEVHGSPSAV